MKAVIMAGGEGSRLRPLTCDRPKPLVPVCNRPVMAYILDLLAEHGFQEVLVTLGYLPEAISGYFGDEYRGMRLTYVVEEQPLGTAGGVAALRPWLDETFLVVSGDALTDVNLTALVDFHHNAQAVATLAMTRVENPLEYGVIMTDRRGRITRFLEKPGWGEVFSDTVNTGIYVLEPQVLDGVPFGQMYDFSQNLFPSLLQMEAPLYGRVADGYWCDIGDATAYLQANLDLMDGKLRFTPPGEELSPGVWVEGEVPDGLMVNGPAVIGTGSRIAQNARMEAGVVLGPGASVEAGAVLRRTVTWGQTQVGSEATLVGAVLCEKAAVGSEAGVFEGAVVGSGTRVGDRATVAPGVRIWPDIQVAPESRVEHTLVQLPRYTSRPLRRGALEGTLGSDLLPESALRIGTALASVLPGQGPLVAGGDPGPAASLLKQALICGTAAGGRKILDVGDTASPVTEFAIVSQRAGGGFHVRMGQDRARVIFYDGTGRPVSREVQRKLEQVCTRQDFPRATPQQAGTAVRVSQLEDRYLSALRSQVDVASIQAAAFSVQVDGLTWPVLNRWLQNLGCRLGGGSADFTLHLDPLEATWRLGDASPEQMLALELWLTPPLEEQEEIPVPVTAPAGVEVLLRQRGLRPVRIPQADWRPCDPLLALGRTLQWASRERLTQRDVLDQFPPSCRSVRTVPCPWEAKGRVMRRLLEEHDGEQVDLVDGLRIVRSDGWTLLLPDADEPVYRVYVEADSHPEAEALADLYVQRVQELMG